MKKLLHIVHCIDTEGPLKETLDATFERLNAIFEIDIEPTPTNLKLIQEGNHPMIPEDIRDQAMKVFAPKLLAYNDSWKKIDQMMSKIMTKDFREMFLDDFQGGWRYTWNIMDHAHFGKKNPRFRDIGFHKVFDRYCDYIKKYQSESKDEIGFHFHPISFKGDANIPATNYLSHKPVIFNIIARRIIDRNWFPSCYRPGFHTTRPDSHWFLEQYIPFEYANQRESRGDSTKQQKDVGGARFGYWARAPLSWEPYNPDHDDHQIPGNCRRIICRCLNVGTRHRLLKQDDVNFAFEEAVAGKSCILSFTNHDFRDMKPDIEYVRSMLAEAKRLYPDVKIKFSTGSQAIREIRALKKNSINCNVVQSQERIDIKVTDQIFGPQPFLAIKTKKGDYYHDNLDIITPFEQWSYTLDETTCKRDEIDELKIAFNDKSGYAKVVNII